MTNTDYTNATNEDLIAQSEQFKDMFTPNGNKWDELMELLEIERELTLRETK